MHLAHVGITGGISEGKSTVLRYLAEAGYCTASADDIARSLRDDPAVRKDVAKLADLTDDFDSAALRDRLIADISVRRAVNSALHPRIIEAIVKSGADFVEIPLLIETALQMCFDEIWVVTCGAVEQHARLLQRIGNKALVERMLALQLPTEAKVPFADVIIRTNASRRRVKAYTLEAASQATKAWVAKRAK